MNELEARIFDLETQLADAQLERDVAYQTLQLNEQTRERHALQVISEISASASRGDTIPTLETTRSMFGEWVRRQSWNKSQATALMAAEDALDDIIAGRIQPGRKTAHEVIQAKENALV